MARKLSIYIRIRIPIKAIYTYFGSNVSRFLFSRPFLLPFHVPLSSKINVATMHLIQKTFPFCLSSTVVYMYRAGLTYTHNIYVCAHRGRYLLWTADGTPVIITFALSPPALCLETGVH